GAAGGLAEGGKEELVAFWPRRACRSRTTARRSATSRSNAAMRVSRSRQPGQLDSAIPSGYIVRRLAAAPLRENRLNGYELRRLDPRDFSPDARCDFVVARLDMELWLKQ